MRRAWRYGVMVAWAAAALVAGCQSFTGPVQSPLVSLSDISVRDVGLFEQRYAIRLRVQNPNPYALPITGMAYRVKLNDAEFGRGVSRESVNVPAYGEALVELELVSNLWQLVERVRDLHAGRSEPLRVTIAGDLNLANRSDEIPFTFQGQIGGSARAK